MPDCDGEDGGFVLLNLAVETTAFPDTTIDCHNPPPNLSGYQQAIISACAAAEEPSPSQMQQLSAALDAIESIPGCQDIAALGRSLLESTSNERIRVFPHSAGEFGSSSSLGGYGGADIEPLLLSDIWFGNTVSAPDLDGSRKDLTLQWALVHEIEHKSGLDHLDGTIFELSPDTYRCGGITS